jgi:cytochrome c1
MSRCPGHRVVTRFLRAAGTMAVATLAACGTNVPRTRQSITGGEAAHGPSAMRRYGCVSCHTIPGVTGARSLVGPPLGGIAYRAYVAGVLPNNPDNLMRFIRDPQSVDSLSAMPNTGVTEADARDIAAYLYTLR